MSQRTLTPPTNPHHSNPPPKKKQAEAEYSAAPGRLPYVNLRGDYLIGGLLAALSEGGDEPLEEVLAGMLLNAEPEASCAAARLLLASAPFYSDKAPPAPFHILREESAFERLIGWVGAEAPPATPAAGALRVFATGLMAVLLLERDVADYMVRTPIPFVLLKRLHAAPFAFYDNDGDDAGGGGGVPASVKGVTGPELARRGVQYGLACLTAMGEYQEMLTPFFQEETLGLDVVTQGLERPDLWCRLAAVELVSRLLAHKKFAMAFVQQARGVETIVALSVSPQAYQLHAALAMCLFGLASLANVMEEVCRLPPHTFHRLMAYAISLLRCPQEAAQKSVVLFFSMALAFRPVLQAFDAGDPMGGDGGSQSLYYGSQSQGGWSQSQELLDGGGGGGSSSLAITNNDGGSGGGLYCLLNLLRSGGVLSGAQGQHGAHGGPAVLSQRRGQLAHYTTLCLRHHLRVHLALLAAASSSSAEADAPPPPGAKRPRLNSQDLTAASTVPSSYFRPVEVDDAAADALLARVRSGALKLPPDWAPIHNLLHHRGLLVLLGVVAASNAAGAGSGARAGASETARFALDCLEMATLLPTALEDSCLVPVVDGRTGMQILLEAASGLAQRDADVMRGALRVLCNCVCPPGGVAALQQQQQQLQQQHPASRGPSPVPSAQQQQQRTAAGMGPEAAEDEKVRRAVRRDLRAKDGIKVLVALLRYRRCIHAADEVRALAARALLGLAQEAAIAQILEKMRLSLLLSEVVRAGPVLDQRGAVTAPGGAAGGVGPGDHYATLRAAAMQLIARITGRPASAVSHSDAMDPASWKLEKASIVARTPVTYDPQDLLLLIHHHLQAQGLHRAARVLEAEAGLPGVGSGAEDGGEGAAGSGGHGQGVGAVNDDAAAQVAASGVLSSASACAARIEAAGGGGKEGTGMDVVGAEGEEQPLARTTSLAMQSPELVAAPVKAGGGNGRRSGGGGGKATAAAAAGAKPHTPPAVATALTSPAGHGSKGITPGRGALKRSFADVVTSPTSATSVGAKQQSQQQQQQQQSQLAAAGALPALTVARRSSLDHVPRAGSGGGAASQGACTPASTATTSATVTTAGGGGGGGGGYVGAGAGLRRLSTSSALPHRTSRLFPAGLSLRRSGSSGYGLNLRAAASPAAAGAGAWPTATPSLLGLPSPFTTHKLVAPPSTVVVGGGGNGLGRRGGLAPAPATTLDKIVVQYLRRQHEQCPNPICALPPFSLTLPHRCPEPPPTGAAANVSRRLLQRQTLPPYGGYQGRNLTRSLVFSRFRPWRSYRDEAGRALTCTAFPHGAPGRLWAGNEDGTIHLFNVWTSEVERSWECHPFRVSSLATGPDAHRPLLLSCASEWDLEELHSETCLWGGRDLHAPLLRLPGLRAAVFDAAGTRLAGLLSDNAAQVYDAEVGTALRTLRLTDALGEGGSGVPLPRGAPSPVSPATGTAAGGARTPNVCFSRADGHLVLSDGVLWDVRSPASTVVHRFDRLSSGGGNFGAFHPNGHDALIDGTVWDLRTHGLRTMVPGVERCAFKFSACGEVIYAYRPGGPEAQAEEEAFGGRANKRGSGREATTCVQVLDAQDYHTIHVHETERRVLDVAVDDVDLYLSIVEGSATPVGPFLADDALCRLYEVGRRRPDEADSDLDDAHSSEDEDDDEWRDEEEEGSDSELDFDILNAQESAGEETDATGESGGGGGGGDDEEEDGSGIEGGDGESTGGEGSEVDESSADSASSGSESQSEEEDSGDDEAMALQWLLNQRGSDDSEEDDESYHGEDSDLDEQF